MVVETSLGGRVAHAIKANTFRADAKWFVVTLGLGWAAYARMDSVAQEKADKVEQHLETFKNEVHGTMARMDSKTDAILEGLHLPNPAPSPKDGGL